MKKIITILLFTLFAFTLFAQIGNYVDVVHLKNGSIVKGVIIENDLDDFIKIELSGGSIFKYEYKEIDKMTREKISSVPTSSPPSVQQQPGQFNNNIILNEEKSRQQDNFAKISLYETQKKSVGAAFLWAFFIPSAGHAYAGNWGRGALFLVGEVVTYGYMISGMLDEIENQKDENMFFQTKAERDRTDKNASKIVWGALGFTALRIWEWIDATSQVKKYNSNLHNSIFAIQPLNFAIMPEAGGARFQLSYNF